MTTYKELADRLSAFINDESFLDAVDEAAAILRSLDAQPVATVAEVHMSRYTLEWNGSPLPEGSALYAAPVAAVRKAMARLADLLDEDKFMEIEGIFTSAGFTPPVAAQPPDDLEKMRAVVEAAHNWQADRQPMDWDSAELFKAINRHSGDWPGCAGCDHATCDEGCGPATVEEQNRAVDFHIANLVHIGKLPTFVDYTPPEGWTPPHPRRAKELAAQADAQAAKPSKPLSDAEIESGVPMHRKGSIAFRDGVRWAEQRHGIKERG